MLLAVVAAIKTVPGMVTVYDGLPEAAPETARLPAVIVRADPVGGTVRVETGLKVWTIPVWIDVLIARGGEARSAEKVIQPYLDTVLDKLLVADLAGHVMTGDVRWVISPLAINTATYIAGSLRITVERLDEATVWPA